MKKVEDQNQIFLLDKFNKAAQELFHRGLKFIGPATGAGLAAIAENPQGVVLGAMVGESITQVTNDFSQRLLSKKEAYNISITEVFSIAKIKENQDAGYPINEAIFTSNKPGNAVELYEGILTFAKNNYEDKKLEFLGKFYGNLVFDLHVSPSLYGLLMTKLNALNYQQLCVLSIVGQHEKYIKGLASSDELYEKKNWYETYMIQNTLNALIIDNVLIPHESVLMTNIKERHLNNCRLSTFGDLLFNLADLEGIDTEDLEEILALFRLWLYSLCPGNRAICIHKRGRYSKELLKLKAQKHEATSANDTFAQELGFGLNLLENLPELYATATTTHKQRINSRVGKPAFTVFRQVNL